MKNQLKLFLLFLFVCLVIYILQFSPWSHFFNTEDGRQQLQEGFLGIKDRLGIWGQLIFIGVYALSIMLFIPASVFTTIGGVVFGKWEGLLLNLIAANIGGVLSFFTARYLLRDMIGKLLQKKMKKMDDKIGEHGFSIILYMRLLFVPFTYLNFAAGVSKIKFKDFFWSTLFGIIPGIFVMTFLADAVKKFIARGMKPAELWNFDIIMPLVLFAFSFFIPPLVKHFRKKFSITQDMEKETEELEK
jgi:uncharacterized membrane protein YdjX (TVP38/TMEM64 family)